MRIPELDRINVLAQKAKNTTLTASELAERAALRRAYIQAITGQVNNMLATVTVIDPEGHDVTPAALRLAQQSGTMQVEC